MKEKLLKKIKKLDSKCFKILRSALKKTEKFEKRISKYSETLFFFLPLITFVASSYFRTFQAFFDILEVIVTLMLAIGIVLNLNKMSDKEIRIATLTGIIVGLIFLISRDITIIKFFLFILAAYNINFRKCIEVDFNIRIVCLLLVLLLNHIGIIPSVDITRGEMMRYSFGFSHPNNFAYKILIVLFEYFYLNDFKSVYKNGIITAFLVIFLDRYTNSRTAELLIVLVYIIGSILNNTNTNKLFKNEIFKNIVSNSYFYFSLIIFVSFLLYKINNPIGYAVDKLLSYRLYYIDSYFTKYGLTLFGNNFSGFVSTKNPLDVGFAHIIIRYGIIAYIAIGYAFKKVFTKLIDDKNASYLVILFSFVIYAITENSFLRIEQNIFMIIFILIFKSKEGHFFEKQNKEIKQL